MKFEQKKYSERGIRRVSDYDSESFQSGLAELYSAGRVLSQIQKRNCEHVIGPEITSRKVTTAMSGDRDVSRVTVVSLLRTFFMSPKMWFKHETESEI